MSRTFRFIASWQVGVTDWDKTWIGIDPIKNAWRLEWDDRNRFYNGYDANYARSCIYGVDGWKDHYTGKSRKWLKRFYHRKRRAYDRYLIEEQMEILENQVVDMDFQST